MLPYHTTAATSNEGHGHSHAGGGGGGGDCARVRPGDNGLPIVYHPAYSKPIMPDGEGSSTTSHLVVLFFRAQLFLQSISPPLMRVLYTQSAACVCAFFSQWWWEERERETRETDKAR